MCSSARRLCPACLSEPGEARVVDCASFVQLYAGFPAQTHVFRCGACSTLWSAHGPSIDEAIKLYSDYRGCEYTSLRSELESDYDPIALAADTIDPQRAVRIREMSGVNAGVALDFGGDGSLLPSEMGRYSYDFNSCPADVHHIDDHASLRGRCQLITCMHVLEHVSDPMNMVASIGELLAPNGLLIVEVPLMTGLLSGMWPRRVHEHITWFSPQGIDALVACAVDKPRRSETYYGPLGTCRWVEVSRL